MRASDPRSWMWSEALDMITRAEWMHRQAFQPRRPESRQPCWEPPVDVFETEAELVVFTALPGVDPGMVTTVIEDGRLLIKGQRILPQELRTATIRRLELPQGCFERRIEIPPGRYSDVRRTSVNGCVVVVLRKQDPIG